MTVLQKTNFASSKETTRRYQAIEQKIDEVPENYLNHPTFGLLYSVCQVEENQELFTTIYANRLFFLVTSSVTNLKIELISRTHACALVEHRLRHHRRISEFQEFDKLQGIYQQTFRVPILS